MVGEAVGAHWSLGGGDRILIPSGGPIGAPGRRVSTAVVQRFCKPKVGGSSPSPGTMISFGFLSVSHRKTFRNNHLAGCDWSIVSARSARTGGLRVPETAAPVPALVVAAALCLVMARCRCSVSIWLRKVSYYHWHRGGAGRLNGTNGRSKPRMTVLAVRKLTPLSYLTEHIEGAHPSIRRASTVSFRPCRRRNCIFISRARWNPR